MLVLRYLCVSPVAIALLQDLGWYDVLCIYNCLFVFFMCVLMSRIPVCSKSGPLYTVISKKVCSWSLLSCVNLIVGCIEFILDMNSFSWVSEPVQMMKYHLCNVSTF